MADNKKTFWADAANAGAVMGITLTVIMYITAYLQPGPLRTVMSILDVATLVFLIYYFTKKRSLRYSASEGFPFGRSMGFITTIMIFTGLLYGLGYYLLINYVSPELLEESIDRTMLNNPFADENMEEMMRRLMMNPFFWVIGSMFGMVIYGGILGLIVSTFVKRNPNIFADVKTNVDDEQSSEK